MKLSQKMTALCGLVLAGLTLALSFGLYAQVRQQTLALREETAREHFRALCNDFSGGVHHRAWDMDSALARNVKLRYDFVNAGAANAALAVEGELVYAPMELDPRQAVHIELPDEAAVVEDSFSGTLDGTPCLILAQAETFQWKGQAVRYDIYYVEDLTEVIGQLHSLLGSFLLRAGAVLLMGLLLLLAVVQGSLRPLAELQRSAAGIAAGNYGQRVTVRHRDEVGLLAQDFNRMAQAVQEKIETLTEQNARQKLFISGVTHEFKTPMTSLLLNLETLQEVCLPEADKEALMGSMEEQLRFLERMVQKLLKLLSLEAPIQREPIQKGILAHQVEEMTAGITKKWGVTLEAAWDHTPLEGDPDLLCAALVNLVDNAAKASQPGETVTLSLLGSTLEVRDRGCGIPQEAIPRLTEPFYTADPSRSKTRGGSGLGLALVKAITDAHGAELEIESRGGEGTCVRIVMGEK